MDLRKTKEELDSAIPFHTLLDVSATKSKAQLAHRCCVYLALMVYLHNPTCRTT
jgi:hypothetical protein